MEHSLLFMKRRNMNDLHYEQTREGRGYSHE